MDDWSWLPDQPKSTQQESLLSPADLALLPDKPPDDAWTWAVRGAYKTILDEARLLGQIGETVSKHAPPLAEKVFPKLPLPSVTRPLKLPQVVNPVADLLGKGMNWVSGQMKDWSKEVIQDQPELSGKPEWQSQSLKENLRDPSFWGYLAATGITSSAASVAEALPMFLGGAVPGLVGMALLNGTKEAVLSYEEMEEIAKKENPDLTEEEMRAISIGVGIVAGALEYIPGARAVKRLPGISRVFEKETAKVLANSPSLARRLLDKANDVISQGLLGGSTEVLQDVVHNVGKQIAGSNAPLIDSSSVEEGIAGFVGEALLGALFTRGKKAKITTPRETATTFAEPPPAKTEEEVKELLNTAQVEDDRVKKQMDRITTEMIRSGRPEEEAKAAANLIWNHAKVYSDIFNIEPDEYLRRWQFAKGEEQTPWQNPAPTEFFQIQKVPYEVSINRKLKDVKVFAVSLDPAELSQLPDSAPEKELTSPEEARQFNADPERVKDYQQLYQEAERYSIKREAQTVGIGKIANVAIVHLTKGCQRAATVVERIYRGLLPKQTRVESCYGDYCWTNFNRSAWQANYENMEVRDLRLVDMDAVKRWLKDPKYVQWLNSSPFIRMGQKGCDSHTIASGLAKQWLELMRQNGITKKTIFISAAYAPVTDQQYAELAKYKDLFELHFSLSGWFHKNEILMRFGEYLAAKRAGLHASIRIITNRDNISGITMPNEGFLLDLLRSYKVPQEDILETPFHDDQIHKRSRPTGLFRYICCETGKCTTCGVKCQTLVAKAKSVATTEALPEAPDKLPDKDERSWTIYGGKYSKLPDITPHTNLVTLKRHAEYMAAKSGDMMAATRLVDDLINPDVAKSLPEADIIVPVVAVEQTGTNAIPAAYAAALAELTEAKTDLDIRQANKVQHSKMKSSTERMFAAANWIGNVEPGKRYLLVDDVYTSGSTLSSLRSYIEAHGGKVVGFSTLAVSRQGGHVSPSQEELQSIQWAKDVLEEHGYGTEHLTASQVSSIRSLKSPDRVRMAIARGKSKILGGALQEEGDQGNRRILGRARIIKGEDGLKYAIEFFSAAKPHTAPHEIFHIFLFELQAASQRADAPESLKRDAETVLNWLGVKSWEEVTKAHHEKWANAAVRYLTENKAPVPELAGTFARFRAWIVSLYNGIKQLIGPKISAEMKAVMDRMLATDEEIKAAKMGYKMASVLDPDKISHLDADELDKLLDAATKKAEEIIRLGIAKRVKQYESLKKKARELAEQAIWWYKELKQHGISREALENELGPDAAETISEKYPGLVKEKGGLSVDAALTILQGRVPEIGKSTFLKALTDNASLREVENHYFEDLVEEIQPDEDPYATDEHLAFIRAQAKILAKLAGKQYAPKKSLVSIVNPEIPPHRIDTEIKSLRYAYRIAQRHAREAYKAGKIETAVKALERQARAIEAIRAYYRMNKEIADAKAKIKDLIRRASKLRSPYREAFLTLANQWGFTTIKPIKPITINQLIRHIEEQGDALTLPDEFNSIVDKPRSAEQFKAAADVLSAIDYASRIEDRAISTAEREQLSATKLKIVGQSLSFLLRGRTSEIVDIAARHLTAKAEAALDAVMENIEATVLDKTPRGVRIARQRALLEKFLTEDNAIDKSRALLEAWLHGSDTPPELRPWVESLSRKLGPLAEYLRAGHDIAKDVQALMSGQVAPEKATALLEIIGAAIQQTARPVLVPSMRKKTARAKLKELLSAGNSRLLTAETILRILDKFDFGPWYKAIYEPIQKAFEQEAVLLREYFSQFSVLTDELLKSSKQKDLNAERHIQGVGPVTGWEAIMVALNSGNVGNRNALLAGYGWEPQQLQAVLNSLSRAEWKFVSKTWRLIESLFPLIQDTHYKLTGQMLKKVEPITVDTPFGPIEGAYFPLVFDKDLSFKAERFSIQKAAEDMFRTVVSSPNVSRGFTIQRVGGLMPPSLDFSVIVKHLRDAIHYHTHVLAVRDVNKLLQDDKIRATLEMSMGKEIAQQLLPWLQEVARPTRESYGEIGWLRWLRERTTIGILGFRIMTSVKQPIALTQAIAEVGSKATIKGLWAFYSNPLAMREWVRSVSPEMVAREDGLDRDMMDLINGIDPRQSLKRKLVDGIFLPIRIMDTATTYPVWMAGYLTKVEETGDHNEAIAYANSLVRRTQGTAFTKDLAAIQRGSEGQKILTMFYTFANKFYNLMASKHYQFKTGEISFGKLLLSYYWLVLVPAIYSAVIERRANLKLEDLIEYPIEYLVSGIPVMRDIVGAIASGYTYALSPVAEIPKTLVQATIQAGKYLKQGKEDYVIKALLGYSEVVGYALKLPVKQVEATVKGLYALAREQTDDPLVAVMGVRKEDLKR